MNTVKKFTALKMHRTKINETLAVTISHGDASGPYYNEINPEQEFDNEEEAINYAYKQDEYATWLILPIVRFINY